MGQAAITSKSSPRPPHIIAARTPVLSNNLRIALVCDWLTTPGGAEKVLLELHRLYPDAPIYTSQYNKKGINWFDDATVKTGWLQVFPACLRKFLGPLRQLYFSHLDLSDYDLVISVTGAEAKAIKAQIHLCYCHVPTQYYWQMYDQYCENPGFGILNPLVRFGFKLFVKPLRHADYLSAQRPDQFITISQYAKDQIRQYYHRDSVIVAPPVETSKFSLNSASADFSTKNPHKSTNVPPKNHNLSTTYPQLDQDLSTEPTGISTDKAKLSTKKHQKSTESTALIHKLSTAFPQGYYIIACRQVTWKRIDLTISACIQAQLPLLVVGDGPEHTHLVQLADNSPYITFYPWASTEELAIYLHHAKGYIFPSLEPFGIAAVEALAAGCPVLAYRAGGSRDFIKNKENGLLFSEQTVDSLTGALQKFHQMHFDRHQVATSASKFDTQAFRQGIKQAIAAALVKKGKIS